MEATIPWQPDRSDRAATTTWTGQVRRVGRSAVGDDAALVLLQVWFNLSDEGVEDAIYDSFAMRRFLVWTSRWSRCPTRPHCCTFVTCWRSISLADRHGEDLL